MTPPDGRVFQATVAALVERQQTEDRAAAVTIRAPAVGLWRGGPRSGAVIAPGDDLGEIEILGVLHRLEAPAGARGVVVASAAEGEVRSARVPVGYGDRLLVLDPTALSGAAEEADDVAPGAPGVDDQALVFRAPMSGRYYGRPAPDKPPFVSVGDELRMGDTVCLLEVMKTFNRITYGGAGLPETARVKAIVPRDEDDLAAGEVILQLE